MVVYELRSREDYDMADGFYETQALAKETAQMLWNREKQTFYGSSQVHHKLRWHEYEASMVADALAESMVEGVRPYPVTIFRILPREVRTDLPWWLKQSPPPRPEELYVPGRLSRHCGI